MKTMTPVKRWLGVMAEPDAVSASDAVSESDLVSDPATVARARTLRSLRAPSPHAATTVRAMSASPNMGSTRPDQMVVRGHANTIRALITTMPR